MQRALSIFGDTSQREVSRQERRESPPDSFDSDRMVEHGKPFQPALRLARATPFLLKSSWPLPSNRNFDDRYSMNQPLHLVAGDSAAGCLRAACMSWGMPGTVIGFSDDLTQGPLGDLDARMRYMQTLLAGYGEFAEAPYSPFVEWRSIRTHLEQEPADAIVVWMGINVADAVLIRMVCDGLADSPLPLWRIIVPEVRERPYVVMHEPEHLARMMRMREPVSAQERAALAKDYLRIRDSNAFVRRLEQGQVIDVPVDFYDPLLIAACSSDWQAAARVVGHAMGDCDSHNLMGDGFFTMRLHALIDAGHIEVDGDRAMLRSFSVRRSMGAMGAMGPDGSTTIVP